MVELSLMDKFTYKPRKEKTLSDVEDMRVFFQERLISNKKIADELAVQPQQVGHWFNGRQPTPPKRKIQLATLMQRFIEWENEYGVMFNSPDMFRANLLDTKSNTPTCPYASEGCVFGLQFDFYRECEEECNLFKDCKAWTVTHPEEYAQSIEKRRQEQEEERNKIDKIIS